MTPPVARGSKPVLGHAARLLRDPLNFVRSLRHDGDVVRVRVGPKTIYAVTTPELVELLLLRHGPSLIVGGPFWETLKDILGAGVATSNGTDHRRQRRIIQPPFRTERVAGYTAVMTEEARAMAERWAPGQVVDVPADLFTTVVRILSRSLLDVPSIGQRTGEISAALHTVFAGMYRRMMLPVGVLYRIPTRSSRRFDRALAMLHRITDEIIDERRLSRRDHDDLLGALLAGRDDQDRPLPRAEIHDNILSVIVGGSETVASTLSWTFWLLSQHPEQEKRLHEEVDALPAGPIDPTTLPYTRDFIHEAMRIRPAAWIFTRRTTADIDLGSHHIPAGADIIYSTYALQRDGRSFARPLEFDPDRWLPDRAAPAAKAAMMPFGIGNRKCPGDHFSIAETAIIVAAVASRWRLRPVTATDASTRIDITLHPARLLMKAEPRDTHAA